VLLSNSSSLGFGTRRTNTTGLNYQNSNYQILENIRSGVGEWNSILRNTMANSLIVGYTTNDESRASRGSFFPFIDILSGSSVYTSLGSSLSRRTMNCATRPSSCRTTSRSTAATTRSPSAQATSTTRSENVFLPRRAERLRLQLAGRLRGRHGRLHRQPEPDDLTGHAERFQVRWNNIPGRRSPSSRSR